MAMSKRFFLLAWLPSLPGKDVVKRVVTRLSGDVLGFDTYDKAWDFYVDNMTPDWECLVVPMDTVEIGTMEEAVLALEQQAKESKPS